MRVDVPETLCLILLLSVGGCDSRRDRLDGPSDTDFAHATPAGYFGCLNCDGAELLGGVAGLFPEEDGLWVFDRDEPHVRRFGDREPLSFGWTGEGPKEFLLPKGGVVLPDSTVAILDGGRGVFSRWTLSGSFVGSTEVGGRRPLAISTSPDGGLTVVTVPNALGLSPRIEVRDRALDLITILTVPADLIPDSSLAGQVNQHAVAAAIDDDGTIAIGYGFGDYRINVYDRNRNLIRELSLALDHPKRSPTEVSAAAEVARTLPGNAPALSRDIGSTKPHFNSTSLRFAHDGALWVRTLHGQQGSTVFHVFSKEEGLLGRVLVGEVIDHYAVRSNRLFASFTTASGVPRVGVWRLEPVR